jgi:hypothetical protein
MTIWLALAGPPATFILFVGLDILLGIGLALKSGSFNVHHIDSFLSSQFGIQKVAGIAFTFGMALFAQVTALGSLAPALAVCEGSLIASCAAATLSVIADCTTKLFALFGNLAATKASLSSSQILPNNLKSVDQQNAATVKALAPQ